MQRCILDTGSPYVKIERNSFSLGMQCVVPEEGTYGWSHKKNAVKDTFVAVGSSY